MTPSDLRQRNERVLQQHGRYHLLCHRALYPVPPSREALEAIINKRPEFRKFAEGALDLPIFLDALMAWASGQPKAPSWCAHLKWSSKNFWLGDIEKSDGVMRVPEEWTVCPVCGVTRPREHTLAQRVSVRGVTRPRGGRMSFRRVLADLLAAYAVEHPKAKKQQEPC